MSDERFVIPGLCARCVYARIIESDRGARFYRCERSRTDPRFPRYPPLPVLVCIGYDPPQDPSPAGEEGTRSK
ncbi:MAG TPA: hypothetical protein VGL62_15805 [Vicinamibacterales bacterium]